MRDMQLQRSTPTRVLLTGERPPSRSPHLPSHSHAPAPPLCRPNDAPSAAAVACGDASTVSSGALNSWLTFLYCASADSTATSTPLAVRAPSGSLCCSAGGAGEGGASGQPVTSTFSCGIPHHFLS